MSSVELEYDQSEPHSGGIALAIILTTLFLVVVFAGTTVFYLASITKEQTSKYDSDYSVARQVYEENQLNSLSTLKPMNDGSGKVQVPISVAMDDVVRDYQ